MRCAISSCYCESICRRWRRASKRLQLCIVCDIGPSTVCGDAECPVRPCRIGLGSYCCCTVHIADRQRAACGVAAALFGHAACKAPTEGRSIVHTRQCRHNIVSCAISGCYCERICGCWCRTAKCLQLRIVCRIRPDAVRADAECSVRPYRIGLSRYRCCAVHIADRQRTTCGVGSNVFGHSACRTPCKSRSIVHTRQCHHNIVRCAISSCYCESICRRWRRASKRLQLCIVCDIGPSTVCGDAECPVRPCRIGLGSYCCCTVHIADRQCATCGIAGAVFKNIAGVSATECSRSVWRYSSTIKIVLHCISSSDVIITAFCVALQRNRKISHISGNQ